MKKIYELVEIEMVYYGEIDVLEGSKPDNFIGDDWDETV